MAELGHANILELLDWFTRWDGKLHDSVEVYWFDDFGGWGLRAKERIEKTVREPFLTCWLLGFNR